MQQSFSKTLRFITLAFLIGNGFPVFAQDNNSSTTSQAVTNGTNTTAPSSLTTEDSITLTRITDQSLHTQRLIEQLSLTIETPPDIITAKSKLIDTENQTKGLRKETTRFLDEKKITTDQIRFRQTEWKYARDEMDKQFQLVRNRASNLESAIAELAQEETLWNSLIEQIKDSSPAEIKKTSQKALADIASLRKALTLPLKDALILANQWLALTETVDDTLMVLKQYEKKAQKDLLSQFEPPIWQIDKEQFHLNDGLHLALQQQLKFTRHYLDQHRVSNAVIVLAICCIFALLWRLKMQPETAMKLDHGKSLHFALLSRPFSTNIAATTMLALVLYQHRPELLEIALTVLLFIPVVRLGLPLIAKTLHPLVWGISLLYVTNNFSAIADAVPAVHRLWMIFCSAFIALIFFHALRQLERSVASTSFFWKTLQPTAWLCIVTAIIAFLSGIIGAVSLAQFLLLGLINAAYAALCLTVVAGIVGDLATAALYLPVMDASYLIRRNRHLLTGQFRAITTLIGALVWINFVLRQFFLDEPLYQFIKTVLSSALTMGNLSISLGSIFAVILTIWVSLKLSRIIRFVLIEDIAPRAGMARGMPEAMATLSHYLIILVGFLLAMSAFGIDLSKLTIVIGALGVGIGIGLQDVVNNFTSGLILLFEQHIKQGDIIQCNTVNARVLHIGLRSSIVRTFDGAEVIVPNSQLVSAQVINWTHSDQERRITIPVGVSYDTDPQTVIDTLLAIAKADPDVLTNQEPTAFFFRFGPSSMEFELRAWVANGEILNDVTSRLNVAIANVFKAQSISIPFPQQDIFIKNFNDARGQIKPST